MSKLREREFCFWLVPSSDGKVRKFRVSALYLVMGGGVLLLIVGFFLFIASDYARVQMVRARNFLHLKLVAAERDRLVNQQGVLESELDRLKSDNRRVASYEKEVKARVEELASVLRSVQSLGLQVEAPKTPENLSNTETFSNQGAMGGGEIVCSGENRARCEALMRRMGDDSAADGRASLNPSALEIYNVPESDPGVVQRDLVRLLEHYVDLLKIIPLGAPVRGYVNSGFGYRVSPFGEGLTLHEGLDYSLPVGAAVSATADGTVKNVRRCSTYGLMVDIEHSDGVVTRFAHLSKAFVTPGEKICRGEILGLVGSTGRSTGPHLHYEVRINDRPKDPLRFVELASKLNFSLG